ncbi:hypothetical protein [Sporosarcina sp. FA9]|uniref:hypothetical protein n=1 Tax=Sporosarcina sp. FA9 TaxID=3413030 RepID=UPI003F65C4F1
MKPVPTFPNDIHQHIKRNWSRAKMTAYAALMAAFAAILQSAGGLIIGIGFFISPFATAPILMATLVSFRSGLFTYFVSIILLLLIQPAELFIFPFTTGLLGLGLGWSFHTLSSSYKIVFMNGASLFLGICIPLYVLGFPVFGPSSTSSTSFTMLVLLFVFSFVYSWIWLEFGLFLLRKLQRFVLYSK